MSIWASELNPWLRRAAAFALWTLLGVSFAGQFYISAMKAGAAVSWMQALGHSLGDWYAFALLAPGAAWLARRFPCGRDGLARALAVHLPAGVIFSATYMVVRTGVALFQGWAAGQPGDAAELLRVLLLKTWHFNILIYWVIVAVCHAFDYSARLGERERRAVELERRLAEARLHALRMQVNPHFLFNALNGIASLMHRDVEAADALLVKLAALLRRALDGSSRAETPLGEELDFLRSYLEIEQARFGPRLRVEFDFAPDTLAVPVPSLLLQPLVENAIKHGIEPHARNGLIILRGRREAGRLLIEVRDNGGGWPAGFNERVGLANTRARLAQQHGAEQGFELETPAEGGATVRLWLPCSDGKK